MLITGPFVHVPPLNSAVISHYPLLLLEENEGGKKRAWSFSYRPDTGQLESNTGHKVTHRSKQDTSPSHPTCWPSESERNGPGVEGWMPHMDFPIFHLADPAVMLCAEKQMSSIRRFCVYSLVNYFLIAGQLGHLLFLSNINKATLNIPGHTPMQFVCLEPRKEGVTGWHS